MLRSLTCGPCSASNTLHFVRTPCNVMMGALEEAGERLEEARLALPPGAVYPGELHPSAASIADSVGMLSTTERQLR